MRNTGRIKFIEAYSLEKPSIFILNLFTAFVLIFGVACLVAYHSYRIAIDSTIHANETKTDLLGKIIWEHQRAAIGIVQSYTSRRLLVDSVKKKDFEAGVQHLSSLSKNNPEIEMSWISNPDSTAWVNFPVDREGLNRDLSYREWYKGVSKKWKVYVSSVYKSFVGEKELVVSICAPIHDEKGKVIGILGASQTTRFYNNLISHISFDKDAKITLVDQEGHIIYSDRYPTEKEIVDYPLFDFVKRATREGNGNIEIRDTSDQERAKYMSLVPIKGIGWTVVVEKTRSRVFQSVFRYLILIAGVSLSVFMVVALLLVYLRGRQRQMIALRETENRLRVLATQLLTAQENERKLVAGEIHDSIGSALSAIRFRVEDTIKQGEQGVVASESLKGLMSTIQHAMEESRRIQTNLRPSMLDDLGILTTLEWHCREFQKTFSNIRIEKEIDQSENDVPPTLKTVIYRISQEALNNIAKHSKADLVTLSLRKPGSPIELTIQDNGQGFNVENIFSMESYKRGLGLSSMRERTELSGGTFTIESIQGKGTTIHASWQI
jgi:signal transduction histidine kinase